MRLLVLLSALALPFAASAVEVNPFISYNTLKNDDVKYSGPGFGFYMAAPVNNHISLTGEAAFAPVRATVSYVDPADGNSRNADLNSTVRDYRLGVQFHRKMRMGTIGFSRFGFFRMHGFDDTINAPTSGNESGVSYHAGIATGSRDLNMVFEAGYIDAHPLAGPEASASLVFKPGKFRFFTLVRYAQYELDYNFSTPDDNGGFTNASTDIDALTVRVGIMRSF